MNVIKSTFFAIFLTVEWKILRRFSDRGRYPSHISTVLVQKVLLIQFRIAKTNWIKRDLVNAANDNFTHSIVSVTYLWTNRSHWFLSATGIKGHRGTCSAEAMFLEVRHERLSFHDTRYFLSIHVLSSYVWGALILFQDQWLQKLLSHCLCIEGQCERRQWTATGS
jgi:hypothetical protein